MKSLPQQAHLLTLNEHYQRFAQHHRIDLMSRIGKEYQGAVLTPQKLADVFLKDALGIGSKKALENEVVARRFKQHYRAYAAWINEQMVRADVQR